VEQCECIIVSILSTRSMALGVNLRLLPGRA
jgi:hypothetical protein